jgi:hypothetical protein
MRNGSDENENWIVPFLLPLFRNTLFIIAGLLFVIISKKSFEQSSQWWSVVCVICNMVTIILLAIIFKKEGTSYKKIIAYQKGKINLKETVLIVAIMLILGIGGMYGFGFLIYGYVPVTMAQPIPIWIAAVNIILLPITVVFAELPLYFGYSLKRIEQITDNKCLSVGYPVFFYALQHSFIPLIFDFQHILFRFLSFLPLMIVLGIIYHKTKKLTQLMTGHAVLDIATAVQILIISISPALFEIMKSMTK